MSGSRVYQPEDFANDFGTDTGDALKNAANAALDVVCAIQQQNTKWLIGAGNPFGAGAAAAGLYNSLCAPRGKPLPLPPAPPVQGGMCLAPYKILADEQQPDGSVDQGGNKGSFIGPLASVHIVPGEKARTGGPKNEFSQSCQFQFTTAGGASNTAFAVAYGNDDHPSPNFNWRVQRTDGGVDNCGSLDSPYPDTTPSPDDLSKNAPITITPDITINVPVVVTVPPSPPDINVNVGPFNVNIDLGGVRVGINPDFHFEPRPDPRPGPVPSNPKDVPGNPGTGCDLTEVMKKLNELEDCDRCSQAKNFHTIVFPAKDSGVLALPSRCYAVAVELTERPASEKIQFGNDGPDVIYAGWGWFGRSPFYEERQPIDADGKLFVWPHPEYFPDTFGFTLKGGYKGIVRALYYTLPQG